MKFELHRDFLQKLEGLEARNPELAEALRDKIALLRQAAENATSAEEMSAAMERLGMRVNYEEAEEAVAQDGATLAEQVMERAGGQTDIALAILGVAVGLVLDRIPDADRAGTLQAFLSSFEVA